MLVIGRLTDESIIIDGCIEVTVNKVLRLAGNKPRVILGITAPKEISVHRKEIQEAIDRENKKEVLQALTG